MDSDANEPALNTRLIEDNEHIPIKQPYSSIFQQFAWMGWSAFGGPSAHIGLFQKVFSRSFSSSACFSI